jgi:CheY-like chemotaxis protein
LNTPTTVLIVEDEAVMAMYLEMILKRSGFVVSDAVATGEDAVISYEKNKPDIILMDIRLSGQMDGIEAAKKINSENHCKIIFMTGYSNENIKERANELNPIAYLVKPFEKRELVALMKKAGEQNS